MKSLISGLTVICALSLASPVHAGSPVAIAASEQPVAPCVGTAGCAIVGIGDFNGDGADDLLTHAPVGNTTTQELGIHFGRADGPQRATSRIEMISRAGTRVAVQDINGDGLDDIVLSAARVNAQLETLRVAVVLGRTDFPLKTIVGELHRGDVVIHRSEDRMSGHNSLAANVTALFGDFNGDGHSDLVLGRDPAAIVHAAGSDRGAAGPALPRDGKSEVLVMLGDGSWSGRMTFRTDATVAGLGRCTATLAAVGDATGDGIDDIVVRRCAARGMPDLAGLVPGRPSPDSIIEVAGALAEPDPEDPAPRDPGDRERGRIPGGYIPEGSGNSRVVAFGTIVASPVASLADTNFDGTTDVIMDLAGRLHVWSGGPDIADRMAASESSGILANASFSSAQLSGAWHMADLDNDGSPEFVVVRTSDEGHGGETIDPVPVALVALDAAKMGPMVDLSRAAPKMRWEGSSALWGLGDFNGDGFADVLSSTNPGGDSAFVMHLGPFAAIKYVRPPQSAEGAP